MRITIRFLKIIRTTYRTMNLAICSLLMCCLAATNTHAFDLDTGNAPFEVIIPAAIPAIIEDVSPNAGDPTLIFRITTLVTNGWFDAIAPYHPSAEGVYFKAPHRLTETTNANKNTAIFYASFHILNSVLPKQHAVWEQMLLGVGLDPANDSIDPHTAIGIGNLVGAAVLANRLNDGMNQLGNAGGCTYNCQPYADYLGYEPVNTAYELKDPSRWQPALVSEGNGKFHIQQFITPQLRRTRPYSYKRPHQFRAPQPYASQIRHYRAYKEQAQEVLEVSASLTDEQKMAAELFDHKFNSVFSAVGFTVATQQLDLVDSVIVEFLTNMASFDTAIAIWNNKYRYDSVRPFSAIAYLYGRRLVSAWGGPGRGTVDDLPGNQWTSYLPVANHPEYPSATASFCAAHAQVMRRFLNSDELNFTISVPAGSSLIEPGITPATDLQLNWSTWSEFEEDCGESRLWGGVHFRPSIPAGMDLGHEIGDKAFHWLMRHVNGDVH